MSKKKKLAPGSKAQRVKQIQRVGLSKADMGLISTALVSSACSDPYLLDEPGFKRLMQLFAPGVGRPLLTPGDISELLTVLLMFVASAKVGLVQINDTRNGQDIGADFAGKIETLWRRLHRLALPSWTEVQRNELLKMALADAREDMEGAEPVPQEAIQEAIAEIREDERTIHLSRSDLLVIQGACNFLVALQAQAEQRGMDRGMNMAELPQLVQEACGLNGELPEEGLTASYGALREAESLLRIVHHPFQDKAVLGHENAINQLEQVMGFSKADLLRVLGKFAPAGVAA